ncbi:predicted protein [Chaetoceros tenuissimus]|uniref:Uncharacterized protein n=1 Tax=Chaetoceros tenuissimus TaxID=426638 RepID=A0AAD3HDQ2_9STRA|nr:predicted protein [Chaetoceros tenuissimus]
MSSNTQHWTESVYNEIYEVSEYESKLAAALSPNITKNPLTVSNQETISLNRQEIDDEYSVATFEKKKSSVVGVDSTTDVGASESNTKVVQQKNASVMTSFPKKSNLRSIDAKVKTPTQGVQTGTKGNKSIRAKTTIPKLTKSNRRRKVVEKGVSPCRHLVEDETNSEYKVKNVSSKVCDKSFECEQKSRVQKKGSSKSYKIKATKQPLHVIDENKEPLVREMNRLNLFCEDDESSFCTPVPSFVSIETLPQEESYTSYGETYKSECKSLGNNTYENDDMVSLDCKTTYSFPSIQQEFENTYLSEVAQAKSAPSSHTMTSKDISTIKDQSSALDSDSFRIEFEENDLESSRTSTDLDCLNDCEDEEESPDSYEAKVKARSEWIQELRRELDLSKDIMNFTDTVFKI